MGKDTQGLQGQNDANHKSVTKPKVSMAAGTKGYSHPPLLPLFLTLALAFILVFDLAPPIWPCPLHSVTILRKSLIMQAVWQRAACISFRATDDVSLRSVIMP